MNNQISYKKSLTTGEFQRQCFEEVLNFFKLLRIQESQQSTFTKREPTELLTYLSISELRNKCLSELSALVEEFPSLKEKLERPVKDVIDAFYTQSVNGLQLLDAYGDFSELKAELLHVTAAKSRSFMELSASKSRIFINVSTENMAPDPHLEESVRENENNKQYLADIMRLCKNTRESSRNFKTSETCGIWSAYTIIKKGTTLDFAYKGLGTSGFREEHHTLIFTTDPGDDHIRVTAHSKEMMDGIAAHVEHIDRDKISEKSRVEAYRLPAAINAAKVRLHIGDSVPVTAFIGRPVFENGSSGADPADKDKPTEFYEMDKLKAVHMSASACSTMFQNGIADCKLAIERMYLRDAVAFMKSLVGNVFRTAGRQTLAAAFNINTPYYDNLYHDANPDGSCHIITDSYEIAQMAIRVVVDGGFDRVTWDGASNRIPSIPIIDQLSHEQFTSLVHKAHEHGLQTYFSAGLEAEHVERCIYTGVDGLGIGTSLHFIDKETKLMGAFDPKAIQAVLDARTRAEKTLRGKAAIFLARLDRLYYEQLLDAEEDQLRQALFTAICQINEAEMKRIMNHDAMAHIIEMEEPEGNTILNRGQRTLKFARYNSQKFSRENIYQLEKAVKNQDIETLKSLFKNLKSGR